MSVKELNVLKSIRNENMIQFLDNEIYVHSNWSKTEYEMQMFFEFIEKPLEELIINKRLNFTEFEMVNIFY